jgi:hypothetical protein
MGRWRLIVIPEEARFLMNGMFLESDSIVAVSGCWPFVGVIDRREYSLHCWKWVTACLTISQKVGLARTLEKNLSARQNVPFLSELGVYRGDPLSTTQFLAPLITREKVDGARRKATTREQSPYAYIINSDLFHVACLYLSRRATVDGPYPVVSFLYQKRYQK